MIKEKLKTLAHFLIHALLFSIHTDVQIENPPISNRGIHGLLASIQLHGIINIHEALHRSFESELVRANC